MDDTVLVVTQRESELRWAAHMREHDAQLMAVDKAADVLNDRLNAMNEFREELRSQAATFLPIARFDRYVDDNRDRMSLALQATKQENVTQSAAVESRVNVGIEMLRRDLSSLAERFDVIANLVRNRESTVNVWRAIAAFVGVGGFVAVLYALGIGHR